ncbi:MAG: hypothetical protein ACYS9X_25730 [Planctomycetota bacterium]|jgi:hypothetical protein
MAKGAREDSARARIRRAAKLQAQIDGLSSELAEAHTKLKGIKEAPKKGDRTKPILSIICPAIIHRSHNSCVLFKKLAYQAAECSEYVEILIFMDNCQRSISGKHEDLNQLARGDYVAGIGDDDDVPDDYISSIVKAIKDNPGVDVITYDLEYNVNGKMISTHTFGLDLPHVRPYDAEHSSDYPHARCPIRRDIVQEYHYMRGRWFGEDIDFRDWLRENNRLQSEVYIDKVLYISHFKSKKKYSCTWKRQQQGDTNL